MSCGKGYDKCAYYIYILVWCGWKVNKPASFCPASLLISNTATVAPSLANLSTVALPIPDAPPK